jgi:hypothetical protein
MDDDLVLDFFWSAFGKKVLLDKYTSFYSVVDLLFDMKINIPKDEIDINGTTIHVEDIGLLSVFKFDHLKEDSLDLTLDAQILFKNNIIDVSPQLTLQKGKSFASSTLLMNGIKYFIDTEQECLEDTIEVNFRYLNKHLATLSLPIFISFI